MVRPPGRTFTLSDAIGLVAATAVAFAWLRSIEEFELVDRLRFWLDPKIFALLLMPLTFVVVGLRLLPPRPPLRRVVLQPGVAACAAIGFSFTCNSLEKCLFFFAHNCGIPWARLAWKSLGAQLYNQVIYDDSYYDPVVVVWGLLLLSRRCRAEPSWIDRLGRAIGVMWILLGVWQRLNLAVEASQ